jgi:long-chain acyl-CoA synthetase
MLSHRSRAVTFFGMAAEYGCYAPEDRFLAVAPLCHGAGFAFAAAALFFGGRCDLLAGFEPERLLERLSADAISGVFLVPTHFHAIFGLGEAALSRHRAPALKAIISNASALPQSTKEKVVALWGEGLLHETYGSTEAGIVTNLRPSDQLRKQQSVGQPFVGTEVRLLDDDGNPVAPGEVGELFSRSPTLFSGYLGKPEETAAAVREGWFSAGDLARADEEGYYSIVDRKKDMIISGGLNIYPREVEEVLVAHPAVREVAVVGVPDPRWGESVVALVTPADGRPLIAGELEGFCRERLAGYKLPRRWEAVDRLPRNAVGKILKTELRARLAERSKS